jgi:hypothetical protein
MNPDDYQDLKEDTQTACIAIYELIQSAKFSHLKKNCWPIALQSVVSSGFLGNTTYEQYKSAMYHVVEKMKPLFEAEELK